MTNEQWLPSGSDAADMNRDDAEGAFHGQPQIAPMNTRLNTPDPIGVHLRHCYQGENENGCKYGEHDTCPAKTKEMKDSMDIAFVKDIVEEINETILDSFETVNHPTHYNVTDRRGTHHECLDVIQALGLGFNLGNALKYIWRAGKKHDDVVNELKKAVFYLQEEISILEHDR